MADWNLELTIVSAANLTDVRNFGRMKVYAAVSINGGEDLMQKTVVDYNGERNPVWNAATPYNLVNALILGDDVLDIKLYCERTFQENQYVGQVSLPLKTLFQFRHAINGIAEFDVDRANENGEFGVLKLSYRFLKICKQEEVAAAVPSSNINAVRGDQGSFLSGVVQEEETCVVADEVQVEETSFMSGVVQGACSSLLKQIGMGLVDSVIPGASAIFE